MPIFDAPVATTDITTVNNLHNQHREAPWFVKRLLLKNELVKQVRDNERNAIDTSVMVYDITDQKWVYRHKLRYVLMTTNYEQPSGAATNKAVLSLQEFGRDMLWFEGDRAPKSKKSDVPFKASVNVQVEQGRSVY